MSFRGLGQNNGTVESGLDRRQVGSHRASPRDSDA
jgi:hypothetical protein